MAPADVGLIRLHRICRLLPFFELQLIEPRFQHIHGGCPVAVLGPVVLALNDNTGWLVRDADGGVGPVHVLATGAACAVGVDPQVFFLDLDLNRIVDDG